MAVEEIFGKAFTELTFSMTELKLDKLKEYTLFEKVEYSFIVRTRGGFVALIFADFSKGLGETLAYSIRKQKVLSEQEQIMYVEEYLNIICGRALSEINNLIGKRSRLSMVSLSDGMEATDQLPWEIKQSFQCKEGRINIIIRYEVSEWVL